MKTLKIAPSMMCADFLGIKKVLDIFIEQKIDYLHVDIMDGHYVPNFTLGKDFCRAIASYTDIPLDIHLMIENPDQFIGDFALFKNAVVCFHPETSYHPLRTVELIKKHGAKAGAALDPSVTVQSMKYLLPDIDMLSIMTVNPGYAGQKLIPGIIDKIRETADYIQEKGYKIEIEVDGNVSWQNLPAMLEAGGEVFVAGTSSLFEKAGGLARNIEKFRSILKKFEKKGSSE
jgi:ribulose-phosphate 3-epimerase